MTETSTNHLVISQEERSMALLGHVLSFVEGGILGPAILYGISIYKKSPGEVSSFVAFHSLQSLLWGVGAALLAISAAIFWVIGGLVPVLGWPVMLVGVAMFVAVLILYFGLEIVACFKAWKGEWFRLPIVGDIAYRTHHP